MTSSLADRVRYIRGRRHPRKLIGFGLIYLCYAVKRLWVRDQVIVSPKKPRDFYSLWKLARLSGIKMVAEGTPEVSSAKHILAYIRHHDDTWDEAHPGYLNGACTDISKSHVDAMFEKSFGYATRIDPTTFQGRAVIKSELNYSGGGVFVECPIERSLVRPDHIYQKMIDNEIAPGLVKEFRVAVICGEITDVIVQFRSVDHRLTGRGSGGGRGSSPTGAEDVFSPLEIKQILQFCKLMQLDFGELDVLPDVNEERLYILDANKTPSYMVQTSAFRLDRFITAWRRGRTFRRLLHVRRAAGQGSVALQPLPVGHASHQLEG